MTSRSTSECWKLCSTLSAIGIIAASGDYAKAQITPDTTLGSENSTVTSVGSVDQINGGATRGANLFHSFQEFNVDSGRAAFFTNPPGIENILSRVTGANPSNILGTLGVSGGNANLFLINPNGIIFGPNARLDIGGSFIASTASSLNFADGTQFSATSSESTTPLLTVSVPIGLQYGGTAGSIRNQSRATNSSGELVGLQLLPGETLALLGGDVKLDGGILQSPGGLVELGGVAGAGTVGLFVDGNNLRLSFPDNVARADISLSNGARVDVTTGGGGSVAVNARNLDILGGSSLTAGIGQGLGAVDSQAGDITINVTEAITVANGSLIANQVRRSAVGNGGGALLNASTYGQGDTGDLRIATGQLIVRNGSQVIVSSEGSRYTDAGNLRVAARSIQLDNRGKLTAKTTSGQGGNITLKVQDLLLLRNNSEISTNARGTGNGGNIEIDADFVVAVLSENSDITANAFTSRGGNIKITTQGILGFEVQLVSTPQSNITSSSGFGVSVTVEFKISDVNPFPMELVDVKLLATGCAALGENQFIVTGRGGLPPNPSDTLSSDTVWTDLRPMTEQAETRPSSESATQQLPPLSSLQGVQGGASLSVPTNSTPDQLVEAQGWMINNKGEVVLTATTPTVTPHIPWITPATCHTP